MVITTEEEFIAVVKKAENDAANNLKAYKFRLAMFAVLGYVVIFSVLFLLVSLVGGMAVLALVSSSILFLLIKKKIIFVVLIAIWTFLKALWIKFEAPSGYELQRKHYRELFSELDRLSKELDSLKIHRVILDGQFNASVVQHPRLGILGWQQNTLYLGLELLLTLSPDEMRSVLAHELGHLSGNHSKFSGWIYRVRATWGRVMEALEGSDSFGAKMMKRFFDWYSPYFSAYSFALARTNEYEADAVAAELVSPEIAVQALVNVHALAPFIDKKYWSLYFEKANQIPEPPHHPFDGLEKFLADSPITESELAIRIEEELKIETNYADTHPALKDRVTALSCNIAAPKAGGYSAAHAFLGAKLATVKTYFDERWIEGNSERWKNRYEYVKEANESLEKFKQKGLEELSDEELWDYASWSYEFESEETALQLYRAFQQREPESIGAAYYIGRILSEHKDEECLRHLRVAFNSASTLGEAANLGYSFLTSNGDEQAAERWWEEALERSRIYSEAQAERAQATLEDEYFNGCSLLTKAEKCY